MLFVGFLLIANSYYQASNITYPCNSGWMCLDANTLVYRDPACSLSNVTTCEYMCKNSSCVTKAQEIMSGKYPNPVISLIYWISGMLFLVLGFYSTTQLFNKESLWEKLTKNLLYRFLFSQSLLFLGFISFFLIIRPNLFFDSFESLQIGAISLVVIGFLFQSSRKDMLGPYFKQILLITTMTSLIFFIYSVLILINNSYVGTIFFANSYVFWQTSILDAGVLVGCFDFIFVPISIASLLYKKKNRLINYR
jgi:hypothetical protein